MSTTSQGIQVGEFPNRPYQSYEYRKQSELRTELIEKILDLLNTYVHGDSLALPNLVQDLLLSKKWSTTFPLPNSKDDFGQLRHIDISGNAKFTILTVACLCSCENLEILVAHGYEFSTEELLFLEKTFESISSGTLELETDDGYNAVDVMATFAEELFGDELLF